MSSFFAKYKKAVIAVVAGAIPLLGHFLGIGPAMSDNVAIYTFVVFEAAAFGVYVAPNAA